MKIKFIVLTGLLTASLNVFSQSSPISISESGNTTTISFTLPAYELKDSSLYDLYGISEVFKFVKLDDFGITDDVGYPQLPQFTFDLRVPLRSSGFTVSVSGQTTQEITLNRRVYPTQEDIGDENAPLPPFQLNSAYYSSTGSQDFCKLSDPYIVFGEQGVSVTILPFAYNPQTNKLTVLRQASFTFTYTGGMTGLSTQTTASSAKQTYLSGFFENYASIVRNGSGTNFSGRYLMITAPALEATLAPFAAYKRNLGYEVTVVNTNTTGATKELIYAYIKGRYDNVNTRPDFVLLVGTTGLIPAGGGTYSAGADDDPLTDLPYALLDGDDYEADVFIGRWPVSTPALLQNIIRKTTFMEMNIPRFEKRALLVTGKDRDCKWYELFCLIRKTYSENQFEKGFFIPRLFGFTPLEYQTQFLKKPDKTAVLNGLRNNPVFFAYSGHGNVPQIAGNTFELVTADLGNVANTVFPFVFSFACQNGYFADTSAICNGWINHDRGCVSFFSASTNTMMHASTVNLRKGVGNGSQRQGTAWSYYQPWYEEIQTKILGCNKSGKNQKTFENA